MKGTVGFRQAAAADAAAIHRLIVDNVEVGHLLPRTLEDVTANVARFTVAEVDATVVGCAELAPLSAVVAEVRSLVVTERSRGQQIGPRLVAHLAAEGATRGFSTLCAFTHDPSHFVRLGFTIVPHVWVPEKIERDCRSCVQFRRCGQYAVTLPLRVGALDSPRAAGGGHPWRTRRRRPTPERRKAAADPGVDARTSTPRSTEGVTAPAGFRAAGVSCGIKPKGLDLAMLAADTAASVAAVFTTNLAQAAPIAVSKEHLRSDGGRASAVVVNSGCANACTGDEGMAHARAMADACGVGTVMRPCRCARRFDRRHRSEARHGKRWSAASSRRPGCSPAMEAPRPHARS